MLTLKFITENRDDVIRRLNKKHFAEAEKIIDEVIAYDTDRRATQKELDATLAEVNQISKTIGALIQAGKREEAESAKSQTTQCKEKSRELSAKMDELATSIQNLLLQIPNLPKDSVPEGTGAADNVVEKTGGTIPVFDFEPLPHWDLAKKYDLIDFELGVKITGAGFPVYKGKGARLQRALINFFLDEAQKAGYLEVIPPTVVNEMSGYGTGQLPDKEGQMYHCHGQSPDSDIKCLLPASTRRHLSETNFLSKIALSQCFARKSSYGKDVRRLCLRIFKVRIVHCAEHSKHRRDADTCEVW